MANEITTKYLEERGSKPLPDDANQKMLVLTCNYLLETCARHETMLESVTGALKTLPEMFPSTEDFTKVKAEIDRLAKKIEAGGRFAK